MTEALPYRGATGGTPLFVFVESEQPKLLSIGLACLLTILFGLFLVVAMDYELSHPIAAPWARGKIEEPPAVGPRPPEVVFSCSLVHGSSVRVVARIQQFPNLPMPSGQVRFLIGYETLKFVKVEKGVAAATVKLPKSQLHATFRALYLADGPYASNYSNTGRVDDPR
ncbi:MAG TPA: hypothetical protein VL346_09735 [Acidobacteriaceae bacterium]|nr:hypothetical protein [Acidobacteriaceae bacterium]